MERRGGVASALVLMNYEVCFGFFYPSKLFVIDYSPPAQQS